MARSLKSDHCDPKLLAKVEQMNESARKRLSKPGRDALPYSADDRPYLAVHDGKRHVPIYITEDMVGMKSSEFALPEPIGACRQIGKPSRSR